MSYLEIAHELSGARPSGALALGGPTVTHGMSRREAIIAAQVRELERRRARAALAGSQRLRLETPATD